MAHDDDSALDAVNPDSRTPLLSNNQYYGSTTDASKDLEETGALPDENLRRVAGSLPYSAWAIAVVELCERFCFFGILAPMQNYVQNKRGDPLRPGGLGFGQARATMVNQAFLIWCFISPIIGAVAADQYLGRVRTIVYSSIVYISGLVVLVGSTLDVVHEAGLSFVGLLFALFLIGGGTGGIKANVNTLLAEQYTGPDEEIQVTESGEKVVVDKELTIQRIFLLLFMIINLGSFSVLATTTIEQKYGFTAAFALPTAVCVVGFLIMYATKSRYVETPPDNSILLNAFRVLWIVLRNKGNIHHAKSAHRLTDTASPAYPWTDTFVDELSRAAKACRIFLFFPLYWAAVSQGLTNIVSQGATMETHGIPNDIMPNINTLASLFIIPLLDRVVFPLLRRLHIPIGHVDRIVVGFACCATAMLYTSYLQSRIYASPPCFDHPRAEDCHGGNVPNQISILWQIPTYVIGALSEPFAAVAGIEYAYAKAPRSMKSIVMALNLSMVSVGALVAMGLAPLTSDPKLVWLYLTVGGGCVIAAIGVRMAPL
ncbi:oligopeptide transporter [Aaosphaeria arxii CBS 175.79]|uniref:Oligopeptide transporter n=1 Tax=Aaosphaeria arxii CBS 175.79 TaxID=1450172 RepID=A0A6A5XXA9_9PLEO|nr:oligopeptide transporter [Aaosphaeria arxii CBS 175.79]KAF2017802.1 oligopeptide transporter [Aaosphaeria arxii CBS 175.79]